MAGRPMPSDPVVIPVITRSSAGLLELAEGGATAGGRAARLSSAEVKAAVEVVFCGAGGWRPFCGKKFRSHTF